MYSAVEAQDLIEKYDGVTKTGPISHDRIKEVLNSSQSGLEILEKFTMAQIINRLKYERKKLLLFSGSK